MAEKKTNVVLRPKRQITIPRSICDQLGIKPGDSLELTVEGSVLKAEPRKRRALDALKEIHAAFERSGVTEEELLEEGRKTRRETTREGSGRTG